MSLRRTFLAALAALVVMLALVAGGCGGGDEAAAPSDAAPSADGALGGTIGADGSSTVGPLTTAAAELFQEENPGVVVTVGISGTGGGFERFCAGETDISAASRPIKDEETAACAEAGVEWIEIPVAVDALTVIANPENDWVQCLTVEQLSTIWAPEAEGAVTSWSQVDPSFPDEALVLAGPGTDSGTFDYFTEEVNGEEGASRADYTASEDDNIIVEAVAGEKGGLGYLGFTYYELNADKLTAVQIDGGAGCVSPSAEAAQSGEYAPLARPLLIYVKRESLARAEVAAFVRYYLDEIDTIAETALFIAPSEEQRAQARSALEEALGP